LQTADGLEKRVERWGKFIDQRGIAVVALIAIYYSVLLPVRDGHLQYLHESIDAAKKTAEGVGVIGQSSTAIQNVVEKIADHDEAADKFAQSHFELTKEIGVEVKAIGQDVGEIKAAVTPQRPKASATRPGPGTAAGS
jgi:hypothetical protein